MTPGIDPNPVVAGVLDTLRRSRALLLDPTPRNVDVCRLAVFQCVHKLSAAMEADRSDRHNEALPKLLLDIRAELGTLAHLLDSAAAFRRNTLGKAPAADRHAAIDTDPAASQTVRRVHLLG